METYQVYEEMLTEYAYPTGQNRPVFTVEADSHDEAYRAFVETYPNKKKTPVKIFDGRIEVGYGD